MFRIPSNEVRVKFFAILARRAEPGSYSELSEGATVGELCTVTKTFQARLPGIRLL